MVAELSPFFAKTPNSTWDTVVEANSINTGAEELCKTSAFPDTTLGSPVVQPAER